jgi:hypothetical protein
MDNSYKLNIILLDIFKFSCYENEIFAFFLGMILILYQRIRVSFFKVSIALGKEENRKN